MSRLKHLSKAEMTDSQRVAYGQTVSRFGRLGGPYQAYLRTPEYLSRNQDVSDYFRNSSLSPRLRLVICLAVARYWEADFFWCVNVRNALNDGVEPAEIDKIRNHRLPDLTHADERIAAEVTHALLDQRGLPDQLYSRALQQFDEPGLVDVIAAIGFYSSTCLTVLGFEIQPPNDTQTHSLKS